MLESVKNKGIQMNNNAPLICEIIDRTSSIKGERVNGDNAKEIKVNVQAILKAQIEQYNQMLDIN